MPTVSLNLDTLEREGTNEPFVVHLGGRDYTMSGPKERDAREVLAFLELATKGDFDAALKVIVRDEDAEEFLTNKLPIFKLEALAKGYQKHFGLPSAGEAAASPTS